MGDIIRIITVGCGAGAALMLTFYIAWPVYELRDGFLAWLAAMMDE